MPSPFRERTCEWCKCIWQTRTPDARTCSPICRARLRETEKPTKGKPKRDYPPEIVKLVCDLYESGMTVKEVAQSTPKGYRVQTILERHMPVRRPAIKRDQRGEKNHMWKGDQCSYQAAHLRLGDAKKFLCIDCGVGAEEWSYTYGDPEEIKRPGKSPYSTDPNYYVPRCKACHRRYDIQERKVV